MLIKCSCGYESSFIDFTRTALNGDLPAEHWMDDALGVFIPALVLVVLTIPMVWRRMTPSR